MKHALILWNGSMGAALLLALLLGLIVYAVRRWHIRIGISRRP